MHLEIRNVVEQRVGVRQGVRWGQAELYENAEEKHEKNAEEKEEENQQERKRKKEKIKHEKKSDAEKKEPSVKNK